MSENSHTVFRYLTAAAFIAAGFNHFWHPAIYLRIVPPMFPERQMLVWISGFFEIAGGIGLLIPSLRRPAGWGLMLLLIAVFPANIYMAFDPARFDDLHVPVWAYWARLPLQFVMMAWVMYVSRRRSTDVRKSA